MIRKAIRILCFLALMITALHLFVSVRAEGTNQQQKKESLERKLLVMASSEHIRTELHSTDGAGDSGQVKVRPVDIDLIVNGMPEDLEIIRGEVIRVNANYDEQNKNKQGKSLADYQPDVKYGHRIVKSDANLLDAQLHLEGESVRGKWRFVFPEKIKLWMLSSNGEYEEVISDELSEEVSLPISKSLKIEGIQGSDSTNDVPIRAEFYPQESKMIYVDQALLTVLETKFMLTFDDGPCLGTTKAIVDCLENFYFNGEKIIAGFFQLGLDASGCAEFDQWTAYMGSVHDHPDIVRYVASHGHTIGNHTQHHEYFAFSSKQEVKDEITACENEIRSALGVEPVKIFRPPYLFDNKIVREAASELGYKIITGIGPKDSRPFQSVNDIKEMIKDLVERHNTRASPKSHPEPAILIFHDDRPSSQHISEIISYLQDNGFILVHFDPDLVPHLK